MRASGSERCHVVVFHPEDQTDLIAAASTRGDRITWDLVMVMGRDLEPSGRVEEVSAFDGPFWVAHRDSARLFDVTDEETLDQLQAMERDVLLPAGRRWFAVVDDGQPVALGALLVLEATGFVDHVVTFPDARRRGHAEALTRRIVSEATAMGANARTCSPSPRAARCASTTGSGSNASRTSRAGWRRGTGEGSRGRASGSVIDRDQRRPTIPTPISIGRPRVRSRRSPAERASATAASGLSEPEIRTWRPPSRGAIATSSRSPSGPRAIAWATRSRPTSTTTDPRSASDSAANGGYTGRGSFPRWKRTREAIAAISSGVNPRRPAFSTR
jgi:GNAT superfamily N-acetyltransferase